MYEVSGKLTVILITIWWLQKLGKESKQEAQRFDGGRSDLRKPNELEVRKQYQIEITKQVYSFGELVMTRT